MTMTAPTAHFGVNDACSVCDASQAQLHINSGFEQFTCFVPPAFGPGSRFRLALPTVAAMGRVPPHLRLTWSQPRRQQNGYDISY